MNSKRRFFLTSTLLLVLFFQAGCAAWLSQRIIDDLNSKKSEGHYIDSVPFVKQKKSWCGPSALAAVLQYWGRDISQEEIAAQLYLASVRGTINFELENYARGKDLWTRSYNGCLEDLKKKISYGIPLIVLVKRAPRILRLYHYLVVVGYDETRAFIIVHSGTRKNHIVSIKRFSKNWQSCQNWTLLITPPESISCPLSAEEYNDLGLFYEERLDHLKAKVSYEKALEIEPTSFILHFNLANAFFKQGLYKEAIERYKEAIELNNEDADTYNNLACSLIEQGLNLDEAIGYVKEALKLNPQGARFYLDTLGRAYTLKEEYEEAISQFKEAIELTPEEEIKVLAKQYYHLGTAYLGCEEIDLAKEAFEKARFLSPEAESALKAKKELEKISNLK